MKDQIKKMVTVILIITVVGFIWSWTRKIGVTELEIGKTYQRTSVIDEDDPFDVAVVDTFTVVDKKDGYVKWTKKDWVSGDTVRRWVSSPEHFIGKGAKLIK